MLIVECGRVELNQAEILDARTELICDADAVAGRDSGVCGIFVDAADAAGRHNEKMAVDDTEFAFAEQFNGEAGFRLDGAAHDGEFRDCDIREFSGLRKQAAENLCTG